MLDWLYYLAAIALAAWGLALTVIGLPGLWLMVAAAGVYTWLTGWDVYVGYPALITLIGLALASEVAEFVAGAAGSGKAGGTWRGTVGAIGGGLAGALLLSIPVPIVGTILGACIGSFAGAFLFEYWGNPVTHRAAAIGWGAFKGRLYGTLVKLGFGVVMLAVMVGTLLPLRSTPAPAAPTTMPSPAPQPLTVEPAPLAPATQPSTGAS
jgi:uncharacterized protein YqgC (DUF456 family)